ncbi:MAG: enoyl-CoA hydratase-related protein [Ignavibacteria bacterium]
MNTIIKEQSGGVMTIILNRPDVMNALNNEMLKELHSAFSEAESDKIRCVILTGNGKGFCSGQDLKDFEKEKKSFKEALVEKYNPLIKSMANLPKPIICGINGVAAGAGLSLALACDFRIAVESAALIEVFINVGLIPDSGSSYFLPRMVGFSRAFQMCALGERVTAKDAKELGLINILVSSNEVLKTALDKYSKIFSYSPTKSIGMIKSLLNKSFSSSLDEMLDEESRTQEIAGNSYDYKEGVKAFLEKRKPEFKGK